MLHVSQQYSGTCSRRVAFVVATAADVITHATPTPATANKSPAAAKSPDLITPLALDAARGRAEIAKAHQSRAETLLGFAKVTAPFAGIVTSKNAQPGEMISPMSSGGFTRTGICTIVDMSSLEVEVDVLAGTELVVVVI